MDITILFKACVKTIKTRNRAFGEPLAESDKKRILTSRQKKSDFILMSKEIVQQITKLRDILVEHRKAYLNFSNHLSALPQMTDSERDIIDAGARRIMKTCSNFISNLEEEVLMKNDKPSQLLEHQQMVVKSMKHYLKEVCKIYSEQRAIRVQRSLEIKRLSRIDSNTPKKVNVTNETDFLLKNSERSENQAFDLFTSTNSQEITFSAEEIQLFELENNQLFNEFNNLTEEVKQIETKVVKIAELQELFTEKVLQQDEDIDRIATTVIGTTENVRDANEEIRQAIQTNAGLRVWVLFFLLVMSFSLLFLDWYND